MKVNKIIYNWIYVASINTKYQKVVTWNLNLCVFSKVQSEIQVNTGSRANVCESDDPSVWCQSNLLCILKIELNLYIIFHAHIKLFTCQNNSIFHCLKSGLKDQILCFDFTPFHSETLLQNQNIFG